ncbi:hypothetical protein GWI33_014622 [Rhynchophorus ferrugineus]|uniref:Uncharacterized protein n=1 Tax=Rhynchophorus ferrugineus TaxID=354439 RepID=A0A834MAH9_RHYFE|nr:hypothetical protein GWI33_014622 [Rhynchophorus ferrugineus]
MLSTKSSAVNGNDPGHRQVCSYDPFALVAKQYLRFRRSRPCLWSRRVSIFSRLAVVTISYSASGLTLRIFPNTVSTSSSIIFRATAKRPPSHNALLPPVRPRRHRASVADSPPPHPELVFCCGVDVG